MTINQKLAGVAAAATIGGSAFLGASVMAASSTQTASPLAQKIASAFHLNASDVQNVINQEHQDRDAKSQQKLKDHLDTLVKNGTITQDQEDKIIAKLNDLKSQLKTDNKADRRQNREAFKTQIQQWLKDNGINVSIDDLMPPHPAMHQMEDSDIQPQT